MSKFAVGEVVRYCPAPGNSKFYGQNGLLVTVRQNKYKNYIDPSCDHEVGPGFPTPDGYAFVRESTLRKLPGDSTSLPSWLTNMLKVPQGDPDKVKQPEQVK